MYFCRRKCVVKNTSVPCLEKKLKAKLVKKSKHRVELLVALYLYDDIINIVSKLRTMRLFNSLDKL